MLYSYAYKYASRKTVFADFLRLSLRVFANIDVKQETIDSDPTAKINVAVIGAGHIGTELARQLVENPMSQYRPVCFVDIDKEKVGRSINGLPILGEAKNLDDAFSRLGVREIIFALPEMNSVDKMSLFDKYKHYGLKMNSYDYPIYEDDQSGKKRIREFTIEDLLQRPPVQLDESILKDCYLGRRVLVTGGGGSIGSEMCRQIASMKPALLIIMDIAENTAYDLQQELRIQYGNKLKMAVEICNMCDMGALDRLFAKYHPEVVIHAAAHKHVPLMEHNTTECIKNNVFGTQNTIDCCLKYGAQHFIMVSTDKAVNPTNVMGASKRVCELIAHNAADNTEAYAKSRGIILSRTKTIFSATRFGNVLGSAGSVVPLFKRQIASGGPITITDKNIIRYFMTIPEASRLVLTSGAIAKNGELFVLDMGEPVHIMTLAENMVRLSGLVPYRDIEIIETGLRPGEKLYEELLVANGNCTKTDNDLIYVETEESVDNKAILAGLADLAEACDEYDDEAIRSVLKEMVPTYAAQKE
ncbi:MAG: polysaccharide biosynthesis protein [Lachnospiraceae bacterium]|nr:polysaccharide biosynthesis protein [Candidatus Minthocola equi]